MKINAQQDFFTKTNGSMFKFIVGNSVPTGEEDISPYATFHLLGMREEAKNGQMPGGAGMNNPANFQTMPHPPHQSACSTASTVAVQHGTGVSGQVINAPMTPKHMSQTMNVSWKCAVNMMV